VSVPRASRPPKGDGRVETDGDLCVLRFERTLAHPIDAVWAALTQPDQLAQWWGHAEVQRILGGSFVVRWLNTDESGNGAELHGTISAIEAPTLLEIVGDLHGTLRFALRADGAGTHLSFSSTVVLPEAFRTRVLAGWHFHLDALARTLDGESNDLVNLPEWEEIHAGYDDSREPLSSAPPSKPAGRDD
jgi:uncharacterized protein YndB with AHSA1/START domain